MESFNYFNQKYNNRIITLFNQTLELFDEHGNSDANTVLHIISEEMNMLKIKKDRYLKFKREWRLNFYVVIFMFKYAYNSEINDTINLYILYEFVW